MDRALSACSYCDKEKADLRRRKRSLKTAIVFCFLVDDRHEGDIVNPYFSG